MNTVFVTGPFPPPTHGMSKNLLAMAEDLKDRARVIRLNTSPGTLTRGPRYHLVKALRFFLCIPTFTLVALFSTRKDQRVMYMAPDAGFGCLYSLTIAALGKLMHCRVFIHHRSFAYIRKRNPFMELLYKLTSDDTHIFLCNAMRSGFQERYGATNNAVVVDNFHYVAPMSEDDIVLKPNAVTLGFLSNLSFQKGLKRVTTLFEELHASCIQRDVDLKLLIAGPCEDEEASLFLREKLQQGLPITYLGYVGPQEKANFFKSIDLFLFPSTYQNEAQPNVLFEAAAFAVPSVTIAIGCVQEDICGSLGRVYASVDEFSARATADAIALLSNPDLLLTSKRQALKEATVRSYRSKSAYDSLLTAITHSTE